MNEAVTILDDIAKAPLEVLKFLASSKGQLIEGIVETGVETVLPQLTAAINIFNKYATEAVKVQTLSVSAAAGSVSTQKAAAVVNSIGSEIISFAESNGLATPTGSELLELNDLVVKFMNVLKPAPATPAPTASTIPATTVTAVKTK